MFPHAVVILAVWLLWVIAVPALDSAVAQDDPVRPGDRLSITDSVSMTPATEWNIASGFRVDERATDDSLPGIELTRGNIFLTVRADSFDGTPDDLLTQVDTVSASISGNSVLGLSGARTPFITDTGLTGVQVTFTTPSAAGSLTTFVVDGTGLDVEVSGPPAQITDRTPEITAMIASITAETRAAQ
ncbi:hypothetical protein [Rhodococcus sp. NBC_00294]|uniref:hypothetical protein n=1 Tax=Rhodococcus sp. NBC_00294 TaxID=2976004 RepID=UPI002E2B145D|nr:hypothetical protein [Rhodococcus sp. NBC_00294]